MAIGAEEMNVSSVSSLVLPMKIDKNMSNKQYIDHLGNNFWRFDIWIM
jgi:hypothetical protein